MAAKYETEAIVIGSVNFGDADRIITLFTKERGKVRAAAFGSRRPKNMLAGLQLFVRANVQLTEGRNLDTVKSFSLISAPHNITADLTATAYAAFAAELVGELFPENQADTAAFGLLADIFAAFEAGRSPRLTALFAAWQILDAAGFGINLATCVECDAPLTETAYFSLAATGLFCENCGKGKNLPRIDCATRDVLRYMRDFSWQGEEKKALRRENILAAERIMLSCAHNAAGKELRSLAFIRDIGTHKP